MEKRIKEKKAEWPSTLQTVNTRKGVEKREPFFCTASENAN